MCVVCVHVCGVRACVWCAYMCHLCIIHVHVYICANMFPSNVMRVYVCVCMCACVCACTCMRLCACVYACVACVCVHVYVCVCVWGGGGGGGVHNIIRTGPER